MPRGVLDPGLPAAHAEAEGRGYAAARGLRIGRLITDPYGNPDPMGREGWQRVRALVQAGTAATLITRWPAAIAPDGAAEQHPGRRDPPRGDRLPASGGPAHSNRSDARRAAPARTSGTPLLLPVGRRSPPTATRNCPAGGSRPLPACVWSARAPELG
ncbi:hypothetical protein [Streptomyces olivaceoviridis]